jgi:hypothetical protein
MKASAPGLNSIADYFIQIYTNCIKVCNRFTQIWSCRGLNKVKLALCDAKLVITIILGAKLTLVTCWVN